MWVLGWRSTKWTPEKRTSLETLAPTLVPHSNFENNINFDSTSIDKKVLPYPIYVFGFELNAHIQVLRKAITIDGEHNNMDIVNLLCFSFHDDIYKWEKYFMQNHSNCAFDKLEGFFAKNIKRFKLMNKSTWHCVSSSKKKMKMWNFLWNFLWKWYNTSRGTLV